MPGNNVSPKVLKRAREAFKACRPVERVACQDFGMQQDDILDQQLEAALTAGLAAMWRPISEAPKDWSDVLLYVPDLASDFRHVCEGYFDAEYDEWRSPVFGIINPAKWQPLPAPPTPAKEVG